MKCTINQSTTRDSCVTTSFFTFMFLKALLKFSRASLLIPVSRPPYNQYRVRTFILPSLPKMAPTQPEKNEAKSQGSKDEEVEGEHNEWKFRVPYKVHDNDPNFKSLYEGSCHCGRVQYQLSREKPLDAKFCHCSTCQVLHGNLPSISQCSFLFLNGVLGQG